MGLFFVSGAWMKTAVLIDGAFFLKRYRALTSDWRSKTPRQVARTMCWMATQHIRKCNRKPREQLYRIFYYDCPPLRKRVKNPISGRGIDIGKSTEAQFRIKYFEELRQLRKVALRLGQLSPTAYWEFKDKKKLRKLLEGSIALSDVLDSDIVYVAPQKGIDAKIGVDIASLAFKQQIDQIILVAGDSDFVPAAKLARREGIDVVLDPMWNPIQPDLFEHIDGLQSVFPKPTSYP